MNDNMDYSVGSKIIRNQDKISNIYFQSWLLYPGMETLQNVNLPIYVFSAEHDMVTPYWQSELMDLIDRLFMNY
jgi:predicted ABC-type transport system involved in lysophospholipase L1 biosynthesis ATPase subunit